MSKKRVTIELSGHLHAELQDFADAAGLSLGEVIQQTIRAGMPPSLSKVPLSFHAELLSLNKMRDRDLLRIVEGQMAPPEPQDEEHRKADFDALRRTYALKLLRWRGHPIPSPYVAPIT